jgi:hypothetical protein
MATYSSPSDYTAINPNYATGLGFYTTAAKVAELLQVPDFDANTTPMASEVGEFIKRIEGFIDDKTGTSYRRIMYKDEHHNFTFGTGHYPAAYWRDYVGFVQLDRHNIQKIVRLEVWQGNQWVNLASAEAIVDMDDYTAMASGTTTIALRLPNSGLTFNLLAGTTSSRFDTTYGNKTAAQELVALVNETFPSKTADMTGATAPKAQTDTTGAKNVSDFFYASVDSENSSRVYITSLLPGDDGANCSITVSPTDDGITVSAFTDKEESARMNEWWKIDREGRIFFRTKFPYVQLNSIKITYLAGSSRVPAVISDAATKLVACEILRSDDAGLDDFGFSTEEIEKFISEAVEKEVSKKINKMVKDSGL